MDSISHNSFSLQPESYWHFVVRGVKVIAELQSVSPKEDLHIFLTLHTLLPPVSSKTHFEFSLSVTSTWLQSFSFSGESIVSQISFGLHLFSPISSESKKHFCVLGFNVIAFSQFVESKVWSKSHTF